MMSEEKAMDQKAIDVQFQLPLEKLPAEAKKSKKDVAGDKETARKIVLKTIDQLKQVKVIYNANLDSLKIKYEEYKAVYSYLEFPQKIKEYYQNTYQLYNSLKTKHKKIHVDTDTRCLIFSDKRRPRPNQPIAQSQQIIDDEAYVRSLSSGVIFELEQSTQILSLIRGPRKRLLAEHYVTLGREYLKESLYNRAKIYFDNALGVYRQLQQGRTEQCAKIHYELGRLYIQQGVDPKEQKKINFLTDYQKNAIKEFDSALEILSYITNSNLAETKANILNSLGSAYSRSQPDKARQYFLDALSHTQLLDKSSSPCFEAYVNLAKLHNSMNRREDYEKAYQIISQYLSMIKLYAYDRQKKNRVLCQWQYACLGTKRYQEGLAVIKKMDNPDFRTIYYIIEKWGKVLSRLNLQSNQPINKPQLIKLLQTFLEIIYQYREFEKPFDDDVLFSIQGKLDSLKGR